jgi:mono/diheme cytochrome c family protein
MKWVAWAILILTSISLSTIAFAQQEATDFGKREFENSCADCHGMDAKGNGVLAANLKVAPSAFPSFCEIKESNGT